MYDFKVNIQNRQRDYGAYWYHREDNHLLLPALPHTMYGPAWAGFSPTLVQGTDKCTYLAGMGNVVRGLKLVCQCLFQGSTM